MTTPSSTTSALVALGADRLAEALIELAGRNDDVSRMITRLTATTKEKTRHYKSQLAGLRRMKFDPRRKGSELAARLEALLLLLDADELDPKAGAELIAAFYRADEHVFESVDDSSGHVGDVFRFDAPERFAQFASRCDDSEWLVRLLFDLLASDGYGVRIHILNGAADYLPPDALRDLAGRFWDAAGSGAHVEERGERSWERRHWLSLVERIARQLKDPEMFEQARRASSPDLGVAACVDIAQVHASASQPEVALEWLNRIDPDEAFMSYEREELLMAVLRDLGRHDELEKLVRYRFQRSRNRYTLSDLIDVVGHDQRMAIVSDMTEEILRSEAFALSDATFLMECGRVADAAAYIVDHWRSVDGDFWSALVPLAETMDAEGHALAATVIYRALIDSVLERANSRAYGHAARHLRKLDDLADRVGGWSDVPIHAEYSASLRAQHQRKSAFWSRYQGS